MQEVKKQLLILSLLPGEDRPWLPAQATDCFPQPYAPVPPDPGHLRSFPTFPLSLGHTRSLEKFFILTTYQPCPHST